MKRRTFLALTIPAIAGGLLSGTPWAAAAETDFTELNAALRRFRALPGETSYLIEVGRPGPSWRSAHRANEPVFVASAFKTFILAKHLQDVEAGRLSDDEQLAINDRVRTLGSPVFANLTGTTQARSALEAMISHSDNTATDVALARVGVKRVRAFIASAGLTDTRIPDSTRIMTSYLAGAPHGVDVGWAGMKKIARDELFGRPRSPINNRETMMSTAADLVSYYRRALRGDFFSKPETLREFKRIQATADAIARVVPPDTPAYAKGGSLDWLDFHALSFPGQMILGEVPVTFSFTVNWTGPDSGVPAVMAGYVDAVKDALKGVKQVFG